MFGSKLQERIVQDPGWNQWAAGEGVMPGSYALSVAASTQLLTVYGCVTRIANVMATMPVDHMTRTGGEQAKILPRAAWLDQPNPLISWESFIAQVMWSWLIDGNVFLIPIRNTFGRVVELYIIDPNRVKFQQLPGRPLVILIDGRPYTDELLHLPAFTRPGEVRGINPIENARVALSLGLAAQQYGAGFFDNSGVPAVVIKSKAPLNEDQKKELRNNWNRSHQGKAGGVGIISGEGVDLQHLARAGSVSRNSPVLCGRDSGQSLPRSTGHGRLCNRRIVADLPEFGKPVDGLHPFGVPALDDPLRESGVLQPAAPPAIHQICP
jgi:phage portal protein BeeE